MTRPPHLLVVISAHGYGHISQTAPIVKRLREIRPQLHITLAADIPHARLAEQFNGAWDHIHTASDFGMRMQSAFDVDEAASASTYREFHRDWERSVANAALTLRSLAPTLVLANVAYLPLAAAQRAGIPAVALSSLNWADIYQHHCGARREAAEIHAQILAAYNSAACFLRLAPGMPMTTLTCAQSIGPVARVGRERREEIRQRLQLQRHERLVLISLGGIGTHVDIDRWPGVNNVRWLVPAAWKVSRADCHSIESLDMPFPDLMRSCDALIGKPGYGTFSEAACNGIPVLYIKRNGWPEEAYLVDWLERHGRCREVERIDFERGALAGPLEQLLALPVKPRVTPTGIDQAADYLAQEWLD